MKERFIFLTNDSRLIYATRNISCFALYILSFLCLFLCLYLINTRVIAPVDIWLYSMQQHVLTLQKDFNAYQENHKKIGHLNHELKKLQDHLSHFSLQKLQQHFLHVLQILHNAPITTHYFKSNAMPVKGKSNILSHAMVLCEVQGCYEEIMKCMQLLYACTVPFCIKKCTIQLINQELIVVMHLNFYTSEMPCV